MNIFLSHHGYEYWIALMNEDHEKMEQLNEEKEAEQKRELQEEYEALEKVLTKQEFKAFCEIDKGHERHFGMTEKIWFGDSYTYNWFSGNMIKSPYGTGEFEIMIGFKNGLFSLFYYWEDESGYDTELVYLERHIKPENILKHPTLEKK